ncbi:MAG: Na/Pi symporter, partial [Clostridia bacterium]|nr:Na/Pi symporter [Clostridia bacterium]
NIGTTITAQITAFNLGAYAPLILFIGAVMYLFLKKNTVKHIGSIIMGFGMLFLGISIIKSSIAPLSQSKPFIAFLSNLENPAIAVLFGVLFTALLQSSSSSVVIFQTFAIQGLLDYKITVYLVIGAAIGSVTPNILASLTTNRNGKRTAVLNLLFNLIRAVIMILLINIFPMFLTFIQGLTPDSIGRQVANTHTIFAVLAVLIEFPLANGIVALSQKILPLLPEESKKLEDRKLHFMVTEGDLVSSVAVQQARMELGRMGRLALESLQQGLESFFNKDVSLSDTVRETEETIDYLTKIITDRLIVLCGKRYPEAINHQLSQMILVASDIERISDYAVNMIEYAVVGMGVYYAFLCVGIDITVPLASLAAVSFAITLLAKDMISDILSGVATAFTNSYRIGDYVEVNGFRGRVQDITMSTTTLVNNDGHVKVFNNRDVHNVLNMSRGGSRYTVDITIGYDQSLEAVEALLSEELPNIGKRIPEVRGTPRYIGVTRLGSGGMTLTIAARCKERDYATVRHRMNVELGRLFQAHSIRIM